MRPLILSSLLCLTLPLAVHAQPESVARLEIFPADRALHGPTTTQQLAVIAHFNNGTKRDVTQLTQFTSSDSEIATVSVNGVVKFARPGDVAILCRYHTVATAQLRYVEPKPGFLWTKPPENNLVDHLIFAKLKEMSLPPSDLCTDDVFLRRAYLDVCGRLPTPAETKRYREDRRALKRMRLIDELLDRSEYAEMWAHHLGEMLELPYRYRMPKKSSAYLAWLRDELKNNAPLDRLVREIISGKFVLSEVEPVSFYTGGFEAPHAAERVGRAFLGMHIDCMQCHPHPHKPWLPDDWRGTVAFFSQVRPGKVQVGGKQVDVIQFDPSREWFDSFTRLPMKPRFLGGAVPELKAGEDRRVVFADWLTAPKNPFFARTMVNRIWAHLMGRGIGDPPDVLHELPLTANDALLDVLAKELVAQRFDMKQVIRVIMNSRTYQLSTATNAFNKDDDKYFSHAARVHIPRHVLLDLIASVVEAPLEYQDMPRGTRAVQILDTPPHWHPFIRPPHVAACVVEPPPPPSALFLLHNEPIKNILSRPGNRIDRLLKEKRTDREMLDDIFLAALGRLPDEKQHKFMAEHVAKSMSRRAAWEDLMFAVMNMTEFVRRP